MMMLHEHAAAQFNPRSKIIVLDAKVDTLKVNTDKTSEMLNFRIYNEAYDKYLRDLQSKQRNFFKMETGLKLTQTSYSNWAAGGNNSFSGRANLKMTHKYTSPVFNVETIFDAAFAMISTDNRWQKSEDYFNLTSTPSWRISPRWELSASLVLSSQFANSYKNDEQAERTSSFFAPAYLTTAVGIKYNNLKNTLEFFVAPTSGNMIMVLDQELADRGIFGEVGKKFIPKFINYFRFTYKEDILKSKLSFNMKLESFWDYSTVPRLVSENSIGFKFTRLLSVKLYLMAMYDDKIMTPNVKDSEENPLGAEKSHFQKYFQMTETLGFGIEYKFETKKHPAPPENPRKRIKRMKY